MAHLTKPEKYNIEDSNIALLGSDLEHRVREHAGDGETAWLNAGTVPGLELWRIEDFHVVSWPKDKYGSFYDGDSYIALHTYKKDPNASSLSFDLHFWLGENTTQDEAGTAAYKTVELDDHLNGVPVQYREVQGFESSRFLTYYPRFICLRGGVSTGFHHVSSPPPLELHVLYQVSIVSHQGSPTRPHIAVRQVPPEPSSLTKGDVFVLDLGEKVLQFNARASSGKEKFLAAEFARSIVDGRAGQCNLTVYDEGRQGAGIFLSTLGVDSLPSKEASIASIPSEDAPAVSMYRISDSLGSLSFEAIPSPTLTALSTADVFLVDATGHATSPAIYVWIGNGASLAEKGHAIQFAQRYLYEQKEGGSRVSAATSIVKLREGCENDSFRHAFGTE